MIEPNRKGVQISIRRIGACSRGPSLSLNVMSLASATKIEFAAEQAAAAWWQVPLTSHAAWGDLGHFGQVRRRMHVRPCLVVLFSLSESACGLAWVALSRSDSVSKAAGEGGYRA